MLLSMLFYRRALLDSFPSSEQKEKRSRHAKECPGRDEITTIGGICGRIVAVKDETDSIVIETEATVLSFVSRDGQLACGYRP